MISLNNLWYQ